MSLLSKKAQYCSQSTRPQLKVNAKLNETHRFSKRSRLIFKKIIIESRTSQFLSFLLELLEIYVAICRSDSDML